MDNKAVDCEKIRLVDGWPASIKPVCVRPKEKSIDDLHTISDSPVILSGTARLHFPVLVSVPHAARAYPDALLKNLQASPHALARLEDRYVDLLTRDLVAQGFPVICARFPRAWIDLNRRPDEIDPDMICDMPRSAFAHPSAKVRGGLGLVPSRLPGHGDLWRRKWSYESIQQRVGAVHEPYHARVSEILAQMLQKFGIAILFDLHSMPSLSPQNGKPAAQCVIGDLFGRSSGSRFSDLAAYALRDNGYRVAQNHPYAGGYILTRHGAPERGIHALQLEVDRALYLDPSMREPANYKPLSNHIATLALRLADSAIAMPQAAE